MNYTNETKPISTMISPDASVKLTPMIPGESAIFEKKLPLPDILWEIPDCCRPCEPYEPPCVDGFCPELELRDNIAEF